jgi:hypothetical protein
MLRILSDLNYKYSFALNLQHVKALPPSLPTITTNLLYEKKTVVADFK